MQYMFFHASSFNQPLNNWNVSSVNNFKGLFYSASSFNQRFKLNISPGANLLAIFGDTASLSNSNKAKIHESFSQIQVTTLAKFIAPSNLTSVSPLYLIENEPIGTVVGEFNATDPGGIGLTYSLVDGNGSNDNSFTLDHLNLASFPSLLVWLDGQILDSKRCFRIC